MRVELAPARKRMEGRARAIAIATLVALVLGCMPEPPSPPAQTAAAGAPRIADRFVNPVPFPPTAPLAARAGLWLRKIWTTLVPRAGSAPHVAYDPAQAAHNPSITWIGHATFLVRMDGATFLTDPMFSEWAAPVAYTGPRRLRPPGVPLAQLPRIDFALISHDHYDHADLPSIRALAARGVRFVVPLGLGELVREAGGEAVELDWWEHMTIAGVSVHCVPAQHDSGRSLGDAGRRLWAGMVVRGPTRTFHHAGDTGYAPSLAAIGERLGPIHLAALPIGAYDTPSPGPFLHMNPEQAVRHARAIGAERVVAMHFGTFDIADEPMDEPPRRFVDAAVAAGLPSDRVWVMKAGETRSW